MADTSIEAGGAGVRGLTGITEVEYHPGRYFGIAFLVQNRSRVAVVVTGVSSTDRGQRYVRLIGVSLVPFNPPRCPPGTSCPPHSLGLRPPFRERPAFAPLALAPGGRAGVVMHFRWVQCNQAPARRQEIDNRVLRFRYRPSGTAALREQRVYTGGAALFVRRVAPVRC